MNVSKSISDVSTNGSRSRRAVRVSSSDGSTTVATRGGSIRFGTQNWLAAYGHGRNTVETFNAYVKDASTFALGEQSRRRVRGIAAQFLYATLHTVAANMKKIRAFYQEQRDRRAQEERERQTTHRRGRKVEQKKIRVPFGQHRRSDIPDAMARDFEGTIPSPYEDPTLSAVIELRSLE
jgi:hypothetical protein